MCIGKDVTGGVPLPLTAFTLPSSEESRGTHSRLGQTASLGCLEPRTFSTGDERSNRSATVTLYSIDGAP